MRRIGEWEVLVRFNVGELVECGGLLLLLLRAGFVCATTSKLRVIEKHSGSTA
jgi:hypothetical protein